MFRFTLTSFILSGFMVGGLTVLSGCGDEKSSNQVQVTEAQQAEAANQQAATSQFYKEHMKKKR